MSGREYPPYGQWIPLQGNISTAYKGAYEEVSQAPAEGIPKYRKKTFYQKNFKGINRSLRFFFAVACIVLIVNVSWLAYGNSKYGIKDGLGTIKSGNCPGIQSLNTWLHLLINILSTLLLAGSNAYMTAYSGPSRKEVDKAHNRGKFLHIGSLSFGNIWNIAKRKALVVVILGLSSAPFHLLYNSLVFTSLAANEYYYSVVTEEFLAGASFNVTDPWVWDDTVSMPNRDNSPKDEIAQDNVLIDYFTDIQKSASSWQRLENRDCMKTYSELFLSTRRNVVLVSSTKNATNSVLQCGATDFKAKSDLDYNWWLCSDVGTGGSRHCTPSEFISSDDAWSILGYPIEYCLSQEVEDVCSLQFSSTIMYVVIGFTSLKVLLMLLVLVRYDAEQILTSTGDAVASFLRFEDQATTMMCLATRREMRRFWGLRGSATPFSRRRRHWMSAVSRWRILIFFFLMAFSFCAIFFFSLWGFLTVKAKGVSLTLSGLTSIGFGAINQHTMVFLAGDGVDNIIPLSVIANSPQIVLSLVYLSFMGIMTTMFIAQDWTTFAFKPQTLMVSSPSGTQRGTWTFGAPMVWGLILLTFQTLLHWFVSQSLFVVQLQIYFKDGTPKTWNPSIKYFKDDVISNCGFSPIAIICSLVAAGLLVLYAIIFLLRRFPAGSPPIVATCSAAISASCHPITKSEDMIYKNLRWGTDGGFANGVGHCSLVGAEKWEMGLSGPPVERGLYAGVDGG